MNVAVKRSNERHGPLVIRRRLGSYLRRERDKANIRLSEAARRIECSTSRLSRIEHGEGILKEIEVAALLDLYRVVDVAHRERVLGWARDAKATTWWQPYSDFVEEDLELYIALESAASEIRVFTNTYPPGVLQTRAYATETIEQFVPDDANLLAELVELRMNRARILDDPTTAPLLRVVLAEEVLHRRSEVPYVGREEIELLLRRSESNSIDLAILPLQVRRGSANATFTHFIPRDPADWEIVNEEGSLSDQWYETEASVTLFRSLWAQLYDRSVVDEEARKLLRTVGASRDPDR